MHEVVIKIINTSGSDLPEYATTGSAGMDIRAYLQNPVVLQPLERAMIPTGIFLEIPSGYEAQMRPRSGLAFKQGITCLNSPGTIFADTTGPINIGEVGVYTQLQKSFLNDVLKLTGSLRYDKNANFEGRFTPRGTALVRIFPNNNIRFSVQTAYRFPSAQD